MRNAATFYPDPPATATASARPATAVSVGDGREFSRVHAAGKFLFAGAAKFYVRGVTYGPFRPEADGCEYHDPTAVECDFALMAANNINTVRTYTVPPFWLLDLAQKYNLRVMVGLPWEQHVTFLDDPARVNGLEQRIRKAVRSLGRHPALLAYTIGNEIPAPLVRWYGHRRIEKFLERLYIAAKEEDPEGLVTYVNYPSTEYLDLRFLDFVSFNVYLESQEKLQAYVARLQNLSQDRPLVMAEIGLDSLRHGDRTQARCLEWQARTIFAGGCAGMFVFAWTDEWFRGGHDIDDWKFGIVTRERQPKPALEVVKQIFEHVPFQTDDSWPFISVVICSYNGSRTLRASLTALDKVQYPKFEVIVVDDGSRDSTPQIAADFKVRLIRQPNSGLSAARNTGWKNAGGEIVAYLDDDASPDPHWLQYLASAFMSGNDVGIGGPNIAFLEDTFVAQCVDHAPGNPTHVLLTDRVAEHLPGCNMAFRKSHLAAIGGFDAMFRIAGDDVDLCWRLQARGWQLGFHPGAMVWHHRRGTLAGYWKQQLNYGRAEAMLERKWPEKYNAAGHLTWNGRLYGNSFHHFFQWSRRRIYHGSWGSALFQSVYSVAPGTFASILMMPEWYLLIGMLMIVLPFGAIYAPLLYSFILLALTIAPPALHACLSSERALFHGVPKRSLERQKLALTTAWLHFIQPAARLMGRLRQGLTPWRQRGGERIIFPRARSIAVWSQDTWRGPEERLKGLELAMRESGAVVVHGGDYDHWDLEVRGGLLASTRTQLVIEEHGDRRQLVRLRAWPVASPSVLLVATIFAALAMTAAVNLAWTAWLVLNVPAAALLLRVIYECGSAMDVVVKAVPATLLDGEKIIVASSDDPPKPSE
ncbi:MAG TPA: glycosyltransferase [Verrucomicrobiae bacterium]